MNETIWKPLTDAQKAAMRYFADTAGRGWKYEAYHYASSLDEPFYRGKLKEHAQEIHALINERGIQWWGYCKAPESLNVHLSGSQILAIRAFRKYVVDAWKAHLTACWTGKEEWPVGLYSSEIGHLRRVFEKHGSEWLESYNPKK